MTTEISDSSRWGEVKRRFAQLSELDPCDRAAALAQLEASDAELAAEVASLMAHDVPTEFEVLPSLSQVVDSCRSGERIGPWRLGKVLGRGGMGVVFEGHRWDGSFEKKVAIKVLALGWEGDKLRERFAAERRILASLDHPAIARLIDAGETADGKPFLVMEFVDGEPITRYVASRGLAARDCLKLVEQALDAVQYAHERLIVHRDLKPSNVLVTTAGEVKILDFGIAKVLDGDPTPASEPTRIFTPGYASPEQIHGLPVAASTDVYSLGVVLYELIARVHPFADASLDPGKWLNAVLASAPPAPSRQANSLLMDKGTARDLDAIVLRALAREPGERYRTARDFGEDLRAIREHRPITARRIGWMGRAARFVRRHPIDVSLGALAAVAIAASTLGAIVQAHRADAERLEAERRFNEVRRLANDVIFAYQDALEPLGGGALEVRLRLARDGLAYLDTLVASPRVSDALLREAAAAYQRIGDLLGDLTQANFGRARGALESYEKARDIRRRLLAAHPADTGEAERLAGVLHAMARTHLTQGGPGPARQYFDEAEALLRRFPVPSDTLPRLLLKLDAAAVESCSSFGYSGDSRRSLARMAALREPFAKALQSDRSRAALEANVRYLLAAGALHGCTGDVGQALAAFEAAELLTAELRDRHPYDVSVLHRRAMILLELGYWRAVRFGPGNGVVRMQEARDILESLYESHQRDAKLRLDLATVYAKLGGLQSHLGWHADAAAGGKRAEALLQTLLAEAPENRTFRTLLASAYNRQAQSALAMRRPAEAFRLTQLALTELRHGGAETSQKTHVATVLAYRAQIEIALGEVDAAARTLLEATRLARAAIVESPAAIDARITLARSLASMLDIDAAVLHKAGVRRDEILAEVRSLVFDLESSGKLPATDDGLLAKVRAAGS